MSKNHDTEPNKPEHGNSEIPSHLEGDKLVIDLRDYLNRACPHPEPKPGEVIYYLFWVDERSFEVKERFLTGLQILNLIGKTSEQVQLFQSKKEEHKEKTSELVKPEDKVDLKAPGVEMFFTKPHPPRIYSFSIDQKKFETEESQLSVRRILVEFARVDPANKVLAIKARGDYHRYTNLDEVIALADSPKFTLFDVSPTHVSCW